MIRFEAIKQSMKFMLTHSWINMSALVLLIIGVYIFKSQIEIPQITSLMMSITIMVFLGVYLGGSFLKLKQNYLWKINTGYRVVLILSYLLIAICFNLIMFILIMPNVIGVQVLMPFCATIFATQMVISGHLLSKILWPSVPFIIIKIITEISGDNLQAYQLSSYFIIVATVILIFHMFNQSKPKIIARKQGQANESSANNIAYLTTGFSAKQLRFINSHLGSLVVKWLNRSNRVIDWALLMPHTKLAIIAFYYSLSLIGMILLVSENFLPAIVSISVLLLPTMVISMVIEASHLIKQIKPFSHVFAGSNHKQLKVKVLFSIDKNILISSLVYIITTFLVFSFFNISINTTELISSFVLVLLISLSVYPIMLCLNWVNMSLVLIVVVFIYAAVLYKTLSWLKANPVITIDLGIIIGFIIALIAMRVLAQQILWKKHLETLMKR